MSEEENKGGRKNKRKNKMNRAENETYRIFVGLFTYFCSKSIRTT